MSEPEAQRRQPEPNLSDEVSAQDGNLVQCHTGHGDLIFYLRPGDRVAEAPAERQHRPGGAPPPSRTAVRPGGQWASEIITLRSDIADLRTMLVFASMVARDLDREYQDSFDYNRARTLLCALGSTNEIIYTRSRLLGLRNVNGEADVTHFAAGLGIPFDEARARTLAETVTGTLAVSAKLGLPRHMMDGWINQNASGKQSTVALPVKGVPYVRDCLGEFEERARQGRHDAEALIDDLDAIAIDVSGADLGELDIPDLGLLVGFIWTADTAWPPGRAAAIHTRSRKIGSAVFQVQPQRARGRGTR